MALTSEWQFVGRSGVMDSHSGGLKYYLLLYAKTSANQATGIHTVTILGRLASISNNATFYQYATTYSGTVAGTTAFSGTGEPNAAWELESFTAGGVTYKTGTDIGSGSVNVDCTNGLAKTINLSFTWKMPDNEAATYTPPRGTSRTVSVNVDLPAIPRAAKPTLSASTVKMGEKVTIYTNRLSDIFTCDLYLVVNGTRHTIKTIVYNDYTWTVDDLAHLCNNATSFSGYVECQTFIGSASTGWTWIGTESVPITIKVPDATLPSFPNGNVIIGGGNPITTNAGSQNFKHVISYAFQGMSGYVNEEKVKSGIVWWTPYELAKAMRDKTEGWGSIWCDTYNGTALVGTTEVSFKGVVPDNSTTKPSFNADGFVLSPSSNLPSAFDGLYIQGKTGVKADFTAYSEYSNLDSYKMSVEGRLYTGNPATSHAITINGNVEVVGAVTDTRGFSSTPVPKGITVLPYSMPSIVPYDQDREIICERSDQGGIYTPSGTYLHIRAKRSYSPVVAAEVQKNFCSLKYRYKATGGVWSEEYPLLEGTDISTDLYERVIPDVVTETDKTYLIQLIVEDTIGERNEYDFPISTDKVTLHLGEGGHGVAVGKYSEGTPTEELFESEWNAKFYGDLYASNISKLDSYDGKNFNELIYQTGYYTGMAAPSASECENYPTDKTGVLEVISSMKQNAETLNWWGFAYQTYRTHNGEVYTRSYYSDVGWSVWIEAPIERGTDGIWTYEKWPSGTAQCWGVHTQTNVAVDIPWGTLFESPGYVVYLPSGLFVDTPQFNITLTGSGVSSGTLLETYSSGSKTTSPSICAVRPTTATIDTLNTSIVAYGRWK